MNLYEKAIITMKKKDISHNFTTLYLKKNKASENLIQEFPYKKRVSEFTDACDYATWYEILFEYPVKWFVVPKEWQD